VQAVAAAILHPFDYCCGIEILEGLHSTSIEVLHKFETVGRPLLDPEHSTRKIVNVSYGGLLLILRAGVEFIHGDATDFSVKDWSDADVVFANSTCFDDTLMGKIAVCAGMFT
jgi:hypothetical protein